MDLTQPGRQPVLLLCTALFAMAWVVARACIQAITIDEADTFLAWVAPPAPTHWNPAANNQLLNSLLMRLITSVFGAGHLALRMPALAGAALFIAAAYSLARTIAFGGRVEWPLFVCLVYNPMIMDHLVAARGYSLALGCWLSGLALLAWRFRHAPPDRAAVNRTCVLASLCMAFSFCSNFSFAFVDAVSLAFVFLWACRRAFDDSTPLARYWQALACTLVPGFLAAAFLAGSVVVSWPKNQLVYGAQSLRETGASLLHSSLYEVNSYFVNPPLRRWLEHAGPWLFAALALICISAATHLALRRPRAGAASSLDVLGIALTAILTLTLAAHWLLFRAAGSAAQGPHRDLFRPLAVPDGGRCRGRAGTRPFGRDHERCGPDWILRRGRLLSLLPSPHLFPGVEMGRRG